MQARPTRTSLRNQGPKRPDKAIYVPRAARERLPLSPPDSPLTTIDVGLPNLGPSGSTQSVTSASSLCSSSETTEGTLSFAPNQNSSTDSLAESTANNSDQLLGKQKDMFVQLNGANSSPWPPALDQVVSYFMAVTLEDSEEDMHGQENLKDDRQELNISEIPAKTTEDASSFSEEEEIMVHLKDTNVSIQHAHNDYSCYEALWINQEEFSHVIEIYNFPPMFKTEDIQDAFTEYSSGGMKIKWVDDTHALGVFSSQSAASHALSLHHPLLKTRTLSEGSRKSKCKAVRQAEFIQPVKERPRTDSAVARRMVTRALGLQKAEARVQHY
ncbi:R3H and coiled-coil domain-containing protein 1 [Osmerus mordax]|uniref:R3H and coiled-coil domain-containing protein 1 n=1 Tax=Osmerus mordax TaxID=8014 RepID=UPI0035102ED4